MSDDVPQRRAGDRITAIDLDIRLRKVEQDVSGIKWAMRALVVVLAPIATAVLQKFL